MGGLKHVAIVALGLGYGSVWAQDPPVVPAPPVEATSAEAEGGAAVADLDQLAIRSIDLALAGAAYAEFPVDREERLLLLRDLGAEVRALNGSERAAYVQLLNERGSAPRVFRVAAGALLLDDFEEGLDRGRWPAEFPEIAGVTVEVVDGEVRIHGRPDALETRVGAPFTGIVSRVHTDRDVVLRAKVRIASIEETTATAVATVHLCGSIPDYFVETRLGIDSGGDPAWGVATRDRNRSGVFAAPANGEWGEIELLYRPAEREALARIREDGRWRSFGPPTPAYLSTVKVEFKARLEAGARAVDFRFDDCRLYPDPEGTPITLQLVSSLFGGVPVPDVECEVRFSENGAQSTVSGRSDDMGRFDIYLPRDADFPARMSFRLKVMGQAATEIAIDAQGALDGAYPGDVWVVCPGYSR